MHRFYVSPPDLEADLVHLSPREIHHALHVLRVSPGEQVELVDGVGTVAGAEVVRAERGRVDLRVHWRHRQPALPYRLALVVGLTKGPAFEEIVQKATELGVTELRPVITTRAVVRVEGSHTAAKLEKWRWIAVEALKQCRGSHVPEIASPEPLDAWLARASGFDLQVYGALARGRMSLRERLDHYRRQHPARPLRSAAAYVGPEGDFTPEECAALETAGIEPVWLGTRVLRSETAALCMACMLGMEMAGPTGPSVDRSIGA